MIYLAGPFFNPEQVAEIEQLEQALERHGLEYYSPRHDGVLQEMTPEERAGSLKRIFQLNIDHMLAADHMLASLSWKDTGTTFELGFFFHMGLGEGKSIISFSSQPQPINVMLRQCIDVHCSDLLQLDRALEQLEAGTEFTQNEDLRDTF